jgi:prepilin-type N-terminal cleavage/methylation domain-containing protein/prepilin-type processing-associated H-X9-DG protein
MTCANLTPQEEKDNAMSAGQQARGFTLIELLVVISIISVLVALLLPTLARARGRAIDLKCIANMHGANLAFQSYFGDFNNYIPPLAGTRNHSWTYNYGTWYECIAPYANVTDSGHNYTTGYIKYDKPYALSDPGSNNGSTGFSQYLYATPWSIRLNIYGDPNFSHREDDFAKPSETGLLVDNGKYADSIYWMVINWGLIGPTTGYSVTPTHGGRGVGVAFMDGHAKFINVHREDIFRGVHEGTTKPYGLYGTDIPFVHKTFWGRFRDGSYAPFSTNYPPFKP